jgi:enediyne biosynthesis protein E4
MRPIWLTELLRETTDFVDPETSDRRPEQRIVAWNRRKREFAEPSARLGHIRCYDIWANLDFTLNTGLPVLRFSDTTSKRADHTSRGTIARFVNHQVVCCCRSDGMHILRSVAIVLVLAVGLLGSDNGKTTSSSTPTKAKFTDITESVGVHFEHIAPHTSKKYLIETMGSGVALFDYDNDGRLDLFVINGAEIHDPSPAGTIPRKTGPQYWNRLYHQKPDGTFEDVTAKAGLQGVGYGMGVAVGDYDNDGYEDLFVTAYGGNRLYHNNGDGTFTDVTEQAGVAGGGWSTSAAWVDLDADGFLDLVVLRYMRWDFDDIWCGEHKDGYRSYCHPDQFQAVSPLVYHNDGKGHFIEVAKQVGLSKPAKGLGIAIADFDGDGRIDLFIANDSIPEFLYQNKGNGTFEDVGLLSQAALDGNGHTYAGMGVDFTDYDNDGLPDLVVSDLAYQMYAVYHNSGDGTFDYVTETSGVGPISRLHSGWGLRFIDYDNDGWKDLLIGQAHVLDTVELAYPQLRYREQLLLMRNTGQAFVDISQDSGAVFQERWASRGMAVGDIDNDGRIDAVVSINGGPVRILHNDTETPYHWVTFNLIGHRSNRDAIGATVKVVTSAGTQYSSVTTASSYLSSGDKRVHFGLGTARKIKEVEIRWPSGIVQTLTDVAVDRVMAVDEPVNQAPPGTKSNQ